MKSKFLAVFLLSVLALSFASAVEIDVKDKVKLGENFVVKVSGKFYTQPTTSDIKFYREGARTSFGIIKLEKIEGEYYFFLEVPTEKIPGNYTIIFEDVEYYSGNNIINGDISKSFEVLDETVPFTISPPLLITSEDYKVEIQNLMPNKIEIDLNKRIKPLELISSAGTTVESGGFFDSLFGLFSGNETNETEVIPEDTIAEEPYSGGTITLLSGETKTLNEPAPDKKGFSMLNLYYNYEAYGIMIYSPEDKKTIVVDEGDGTDIPDNQVEENKTIEEVIKEKEIEEVKKEVEEKLEEQGIDKETVNITDEGKVIDKETGEEIDLEPKTCSELGGTFCTIGQEKCSGAKEISIGGECCLGICETIEKSSTGKVIGYFIIAAIVIFLTWFFKQKYKKAAPGKIDILQKSKPSQLKI